MHLESTVEDAFSLRAAAIRLVEVAGTTPEGRGERAGEFEIAPPAEAASPDE